MRSIEFSDEIAYEWPVKALALKPVFAGIADRKATSLEKLLGRSVDYREVAARLVQHFAQVFGPDLRAASIDELLEILRQAEVSENVASPVAQPMLAAQEVP